MPYAVRAGWRPGVYDTWPEVQAQIKGFSQPQFHQFRHAEDARGYLALAALPDGELLHIGLCGRGACLHSPTAGSLLCVPPGGTRYQSEAAVLDAFLQSLADAHSGRSVFPIPRVRIAVDTPAILKLNKAGAAFHTGPLAQLARGLARLPPGAHIQFVLSEGGRALLQR